MNSICNFHTIKNSRRTQWSTNLLIISVQQCISNSQPTGKCLKKYIKVMQLATDLKYGYSQNIVLLSNIEDMIPNNF